MKKEIFEKACKISRNLTLCEDNIDFINQQRKQIAVDRSLWLRLCFECGYPGSKDSGITVDNELRDQIIDVALSYYEEKKKILKTEFEAL